MQEVAYHPGSRTSLANQTPAQLRREGTKAGKGRLLFHPPIVAIVMVHAAKGVPESPKSKVLMMSACIYPPSSKYTKRLLGRMAAPWAMAASPRLRGGLRVATQVATLQER
mmetsp:Transcript_81035/g.135580  ORF Transcript_81035/g.135580 Transcript_81035/m.135580 type:complete len:111 (+) Transcript_81035:1896-2228(+)